MNELFRRHKRAAGAAEIKSATNNDITTKKSCNGIHQNNRDWDRGWKKIQDPVVGKLST
jgi:hypothetical protein